MLIVFISALFFGFVHPGSKVLLDQGIPLSYFCLLYIGIRFIVQFMFILKKRGMAIKSSKIFFSLVAIGLVGALLQLFEFKGIDQGLPPATVTFLMFSYPAWILIANFLNKKNSVGVIELVQSLAVMVGIYFMSQNEISNFNFNSSAYIYPLLASVLIAGWVILSNRLRKEGVSSFQLSAYYDLFSLISLLAIFSEKLLLDWPQFLSWSLEVKHIYGMVLYSILIGLVPNFLFYFGSRKVSSHYAGTILALEPVFSSIYSAIIWEKAFGSHFIIGGLFILLANIPKEFLVSAVQRVVYEK